MRDRETVRPGDSETEDPAKRLGLRQSSGAFFSTPAAQVRLQSIARSWLNTPFVPHAAIRGAGVDCVHLCGEIYIECGALQLFDPPRYNVDAGPHGNFSLIAEWLERSGRFQVLSRSHVLTLNVAIGDLLTFTVGRRDYHVGIQITPRTFIHAARSHGVIESNLHDPTYSSRLMSLWRPLSRSVLDCASPLALSNPQP